MALSIPKKKGGAKEAEDGVQNLLLVAYEGRELEVKLSRSETDGHGNVILDSYKDDGDDMITIANNDLSQNEDNEEPPRLIVELTTAVVVIPPPPHSIIEDQNPSSQ